MKRNQMKDIVVSGFALFAIFFGAGNLIFPPLLGNMAGQSWPMAMAGFLSTDPVLPILGVIATAFVGGRAQDLGRRLSPTFAAILAGICILLIGPILSVPRTAATTYEMAINPYVPAAMVPLATVITSIIFFAVTYYFTLNQGKVIDIIGQYLTPGLLVVLTIIIIKAVITPIGDIVPTDLTNAYNHGFVEGYQTMDALGASLMCGIVLTDLLGKGYADKKSQRGMLIKVGLVAGVLLALVYGGLTYVGATTSAEPAQDRVALLLHVVQQILGPVGGVLIGICVTLACLTTAIGLTSACGNFFASASKGRISYKLVVTLAIIVSFLMSLLSVSGIVELAVPILLTVYPVVIALILMTLFDGIIPSRLTYAGPVLVAGVLGFIEAMNTTFGWFEPFHQALINLPFGKSGFPWAFPTLVTIILFFILGMVLPQGRALPEMKRSED